MSQHELQKKIAAVVSEAQEKVARAVCDTPRKYHRYLTLIDQNKKVKVGSFTGYAPIQTPYMAVDGRVQECSDEHREGKSRYTIDTSFYPVGDNHVLAKSIVDSQIRGVAVGHAIVPLSSTSGAEATNPFEVAETSAVGRALGFLGYGLLGAGIASAEDVQAAREKQSSEGPVEPEPPPPEKEAPGPEAAKDDPMVQAALEAFPGSRHVKTNDLRDNEGRKVRTASKTISRAQVGLLRGKMRTVGFKASHDQEALAFEIAGVPIDKIAQDDLDDVIEKVLAKKKEG